MGYEIDEFERNNAARKDWRANLNDIDNLYDIDPGSILVFLRHQYLLTAKDMLKDDWTGMGVTACIVVEAIQEALEAQVKEPLDIEMF